MIGIILSMHYFTLHNMRYHHALYRMLFYIPLALGSAWFGMKGAMHVCGSISILFLPHAISQWQDFSFDDFNRLLEGVLYIVIAFILGFLVEKERKNHKALVRAESLAAFGRTVSEVVHDMNPPLMAIGGFARQVSRKLGNRDPNHKKLDIIIQETTRLESMVGEMLDFGKPMKLQITDTNLNELVLDSIKVTTPLAIKARVALKTDLVDSLSPMAVDGTRVKQMLLNLITNAVQASVEGEQVLVKTVQVTREWCLRLLTKAMELQRNILKAFFIPSFQQKRAEQVWVWVLLKRL